MLARHGPVTRTDGCVVSRAEPVALSPDHVNHAWGLTCDVLAVNPGWHPRIFLDLHDRVDANDIVVETAAWFHVGDVSAGGFAWPKALTAELSERLAAEADR